MYIRGGRTATAEGGMAGSGTKTQVHARVMHVPEARLSCQNADKCQPRLYRPETKRRPRRRQRAALSRIKARRHGYGARPGLLRTGERFRIKDVLQTSRKGAMIDGVGGSPGDGRHLDNFLFFVVVVVRIARRAHRIRREQLRGASDAGPRRVFICV